jgi:hypothetical protein
MKGLPKRLAILLGAVAVTALPHSAAMATEPAPARAGKAAVDTQHSHIGTHAGPATQRPTQPLPEAARQIWHRRALLRAKAGAAGPQGGPDALAGRGKAVSAGPSGLPPRSFGTSPALGSGAASNAGRISGTGLPVKGTSPAVIRPPAKTGARVSGTGFAGKSR